MILVLHQVHVSKKSFRENIITNHDNYRWKRYDIDKEAAKISALSSGITDKYEYLIDEGILPCNQSRILEQAKFTYFPLGKTFEKQIKITEEQRNK